MSKKLKYKDLYSKHCQLVYGVYCLLAYPRLWASDDYVHNMLSLHSSDIIWADASGSIPTPELLSYKKQGENPMIAYAEKVTNVSELRKQILWLQEELVALVQRNKQILNQQYTVVQKIFNQDFTIAANFEILGCQVIMTCAFRPEQYDVFKGEIQIGYIRFRFGAFSARTPDFDGEEVYSAKIGCDMTGEFYDDAESRRKHLVAAVAAILCAIPLPPPPENDAKSEIDFCKAICHGLANLPEPDNNAEPPHP